ncbi:GDSL esterase/lipase At5g55050-like [Fagus crenata]
MAYNVLLRSFLLFLSSFILSFNFLEAQMVPAVFVFGDSLVDVGNNNYLKVSLAKADFPHNGIDFPTKKPTGRFTNGKNAADFLAEKVGLPTSPPYLSLVSKSNKNNGSFLTGYAQSTAPNQNHSQYSQHNQYAQSTAPNQQALNKPDVMLHTCSSTLNSSSPALETLEPLPPSLPVTSSLVESNLVPVESPFSAASSTPQSSLPSAPISQSSLPSTSIPQPPMRQSIPLTKQVDYYTTVFEDLKQQLGSSGAQNLLSKSLTAIVIGSNDILGYFDSSDLRKQNTPQQFVDLMAATLKAQMKRIYNSGARKFVIAGTGAIGCCPSERNKNKTEECNEEVNHWSVKYNEGLKSMLQGLKSELKDIKYSYFDTYSVLLSFIQNPTAYGFAEVKSACCGLGNLNAKVACLPIAKYCSNRRDHVFWDLYHPTEAAHRILVDDIFDGSSQYTFPMNVRQLIAV